MQAHYTVNVYLESYHVYVLQAMKLYWDTRTDLHIGTLMKQTFSFISEKNRCSLHAIRREVSLTLRLIPNFALRKLHFQPICLLHLRDLQEIEFLTKKFVSFQFYEIYFKISKYFLNFTKNRKKKN